MKHIYPSLDKPLVGPLPAPLILRQSIINAPYRAPSLANLMSSALRKPLPIEAFVPSLSSAKRISDDCSSVLNHQATSRWRLFYMQVQACPKSPTGFRKSLFRPYPS